MWIYPNEHQNGLVSGLIEGSGMSMAVLLEFLLCPEALLHPSELMGQTQNSSTGGLQLPDADSASSTGNFMGQEYYL